jgi:PKD repeat protein
MLTVTGGETQTSGLRTKLVVLIIIIALASSSNSQLGHWLPSVSEAHSQSGIMPKIAVDPPSFTTLNPPSGTVPFTVNVTDAPAINQFFVSLDYNSAVLKGPTVDISNTVLGPGLSPNIECVNGVSLIHGSCTDIDTTYSNVVTLLLAKLGSDTGGPTSGVLFTVTFNVVGVGVSQIHLLVARIQNGFAANPEIPAQSFDGFFSNEKCGGQFCQPPVVGFAISPAKINQGRLITFDASASYSVNPGSFLAQYLWIWGDHSPAILDGKVADHTFNFSGNYTMTLKVTDNLGVTGSKSVRIRVLNFVRDVGISSFEATPARLFPGTPIIIKAVAGNLGTVPMNLTLTISWEGRILKSQNYTLPRNSVAPPLVYQFDTTGVQPRAYRIDATVFPLNDDNPGNNAQTIYVLLIEPLGSSLVSLSLLQSTSLSVAVLVALGFAILLIKARSKTEVEEL